ncbi:MAG: hypothetical protein AAF799_00850 [Myxococcota bacterium]
MPGPRPRHAALGAVAWLGIAGLLAMAATGCRRDPPPPGVEDLSIEDPLRFHEREGYVRLVPPTHIPSSSALVDQVEIWMWLPPDARIDAHDDTQGRPTLEFPAGTIVDRVEFFGTGDRRAIADIRGTRINEDGAQDFHVYRPTAPDPAAPLFGLRWAREDTEAHAAATDRLVAKALEHPPAVGKPQPWRDRFAKGIRVRNRCAGCHGYSRLDNDRPKEHGLVNRGTDRSGFVVPQTVLWDEAPLESYGAHDRSWDDPSIEIRCGEVPAAGPRKGCEDGSVPLGRLRWDAEEPEAHAHLREVCEGRAWLITHMADQDGPRWSGLAEDCKKVGIDW